MAFLTFAAFAAITAPQPWVWGRQDCTMWVADWCAARWGIDPALPFRDRYDSEAGANALIEDAGGLIDLIRPQMVFLSRKPSPDEGDVGVIEIGGRQISAIFVDGQWAFRTAAGIGFMSADALIVWGD